MCIISSTKLFLVEMYLMNHEVSLKTMMALLQPHLDADGAAVTVAVAVSAIVYFNNKTRRSNEKLIRLKYSTIVKTIEKIQCAL